MGTVNELFVSELGDTGVYRVDVFLDCDEYDGPVMYRAVPTPSKVMFSPCTGRLEDCGFMPVDGMVGATDLERVETAARQLFNLG